MKVRSLEGHYFVLANTKEEWFPHEVVELIVSHLYFVVAPCEDCGKLQRIDIDKVHVYCKGCGPPPLETWDDYYSSRINMFAIDFDLFYGRLVAPPPPPPPLPATIYGNCNSCKRPIKRSYKHNGYCDARCYKNRHSKK